jgi:hypothetical protein
MDRREAIKWMLSATAAVSMLHLRTFGAPSARGYGTDPNLMDYYSPGDFWPLTLSSRQRETAAALCDAIIPADDQSPAASAVGVTDFIDEWISAPYPAHVQDKQEIVDGLAWLDGESERRFQKRFVNLSGEQKEHICDDICDLGRAKRKFIRAARFFARFRNLTAGGFYTTYQGQKDLQYIGNVALTRFDGPPPEVLAYLKLQG